MRVRSFGGKLTLPNDLFRRKADTRWFRFIITLNQLRGEQMYRAIVPFLLFTTECWAHSGHGAPLGHLHGWDWGHLVLGIAIAAVAALAAWKAK